jgi:polyhydroxyalkanoate synthesis regulator phasin
MVHSKITNRWGLSRLLALTFIFALLISVGASRADDKKEKSKTSPKDLHKQIEAAVIAGKITKEEAQAKLNALKKQGSSRGKTIKESGNQKTNAHLENIWAELQSLVASGKMSQEEANTVMSTIKKQVFTESSSTKKAQVKLTPNDLYKQIEAAVVAGKITKEEAQAKLSALKKEAYGKNNVKSAATKTKAPSKNDYKLIEAAVIAGKITKEEAQAKLKSLQQKKFPQKNVKSYKKKDSSKAKQGNAATEAYLKKVWAELEAAVAAGKLTKEQAIAKMTAIKKAKLGGK